MESEDRPNDQHSSIQYKTIRSRVLTGVLSQHNKGAIDWGWQSLLAFGCQSVVVVIDSKNIQVLQTLDKHKSPVITVKWARENYYHDISNPYYPKLASADNSGNIIIWDVIYSKSISAFSDSNKPVLDMEWLGIQDGSNDFLAALHPPYSFIIWNTTNGNKLWKKTYTETLTSFSFDPFNPSNVAFLAQEFILFIDDFTLSKVPSSNGRKFFVSSSTTMSSSSTNLSTLGSNTGPISQEEKLWTKEKLRKRMKFLVRAESKPTTKSEETLSLTECLQLVYHKACRHHLLLLYSKEILILDLEINQTVGIIAIERNGCPFVQVVPCQQRDVLYCLHENGSITMRVRRRSNNLSILMSPVDASYSAGNSMQHHFYEAYPERDMLGEIYLEVGYDLCCQSDPLRLTKHNRLLGMSCCPVTEAKATLILSDGRLLFLDLIAFEQLSHSKQLITQYNQSLNILNDYYTNKKGTKQEYEISSELFPKSSVSSPKMMLSDFIKPSTYYDATHSTKLESVEQGLNLKFLLTGLLSGLSAPPVVIRMCPPLTTKNWNVYEPLMAVGTPDGTVQVFNVASGLLVKELSIHSAPVRGIEWVSLSGFLSFAYPNVSNSAGLVRNELILTHTITGKIRPLRMEKGEESPIEMIRVSHLKQYFIIAFKDEPFELWDLRTLSLLRTMSKKFPVITALEWSPVHNLRTLKKKSNSVDKEGFPGLGIDSSESVTGTEISSESRGSTAIKEHFVFTDTEGQLYHFCVEGNVIKDGSKIPSNGGLGCVTCIAWRGDQIVMGDVDGNLNLWDLKARMSKSISTHRGWIKKIKFAPGRGNMKILVLYNDGIDIWDVREVELLSQLKCPRDLSKIQDVDWAASDTPTVATIDGCIRLMDIKLKRSASPIFSYEIQESSFLPHLSTSEAALNLRGILQHQGWRNSYSLQFSEEDNIRGEDLNNLKHHISLIDSEIQDYLLHCSFGTAERCLYTARLFGDESELHFWTVALHYLKAKLRTKDFNYEGMNYSSNIDKKRIPDEPLDCCYDVFCDSASFQKLQLDRIALHDSKRTTYEQTKKCAETLMMLGQADRAVQLLLETDSDNDNYYIDCLRACLVASIRSSGASQSTIKLVATNLIASGRISEGVQLLCLIDKSLDACRYLQSYGHWNQAVWLSKATLNYTECLEVMRRWVDYLNTPHVNQKSKAILVLLSMGQFQKVIEMLCSMKCIERAAMFIHACKEFNALEENDSNSLINGVFLEYARYLFCLGNTSAAYYYCGLLGSLGEQLKKEMQILAEDAVEIT